MRIVCSHCGCEVEKPTGHVNRARKLGMKMFCSQKCFGLDRRVNRTEEEWKKIKADYDREYRKNNPIKDLKTKAYNESPRGRAAQKRNREKRKEKHAEYIKSERYRKWKHDYDKKYHAQSNYGEFWEAAILLNEIETILLPQRLEVKIQKGIYNKSQNRKRHGTYRQKSQGITMGNPSRSTNW